jgi:hypothetical protein
LAIAPRRGILHQRRLKERSLNETRGCPLAIGSGTTLHGMEFTYDVEICLNQSSQL